MAILNSIRRQPLMSAVVVLLLVPLVLAAIAPALAPIPAATAGWSAPPLPERDEPLPDFQHLLDPLPLVVRDLPDAESQSLVAIYDRTTYTDNQSAMEMLAAAKTAIPVSSHLERTWNTWLNDPQIYPVPLAVMDSLADDPRNADRLSNLAAAMFLNSVVNEPDDFAGVYSYAPKPTELLSSVLQYYPDSRAANINYFYLNPLSGLVWDDEGVLWKELENWLQSHPEDATAYQHAVHLLLSDYQPTDETIRAFLQAHASNFTESNDTARNAFGHAMLGDLQLGNLRVGGNPTAFQGEASPFTLLNSARLALHHYDTALQFADDPALYIARAYTLSLLGDVSAAISTLNYASELYPESAEIRFHLADYYLEKRGSVDEIKESITAAREEERSALALQMERPGSLFSQIRVTGNVRSLTAQVANRPNLHTLVKSHGGAGGGYTVAFDMIPEYERSPSDVGSMSVALGDPQGVLEDAERFGTISPEKSEYRASVANMVADPDNVPSDYLQDRLKVNDAAQWLRYLGSYEKAQQLCQAAVDVNTDEWERRWLMKCVAANAFLAEDYETAEEMYLASDDAVMAGYVIEAQGDENRAARLYSSELDADFGSRYMAMLRLAGVQLDSGDYDDAKRHYDEWLEWAASDLCDETGCVSCVMNDCYALTHLLPHAFSNRGIARLQMLTDRNSSIDCSGDNRDVCTAAAADFDQALEFDAFNPVFLMNRAWVARLLGENELSSQLMEKALESDSSLYPVLNDMGVLAADNGDSDTAHTYFMDAAAANPDYELAWWNLGVLEMKKGPGGILRGQAYLARAIVRDPSLVTSSLNFKTDESIYRVEITEQVQPGAGWAFGTASSLATSAFGFLGAAFIIFQASRHVLKDKIAEYVASRVDSVRPWIERNVDPVLARLQGWQGYAWGLLALTILVMILATVVPAWRGDPGAASAAITIALFAMVVAVITHELGHRISAAFMKAEIEPVQWGPGVGLSLFLLPINLSSGPFPAQRVKSNDRTTTLWVYLFGPLANLGASLVLYTIYLAQPLPILRVMAITQLVVMSYSLLPFEPLDGAPLSRAQPKLVGALAFFALLAGTLFTVGVL